MADAEIKLTADAKQAKQEIGDLRAVIDRTISSLGIAGAQGKAAGDVLEREFREMGVSAEEAEKSLEGVVERLKEQQPFVQQQGVSLKDLSKSFLGVVSVVGILRANYKAIEPEMVRFGELVESAAVSLGLKEKRAEQLKNALVGLTNPLKIAESLIANIKISAEEAAEALENQAAATHNLSREQVEGASRMARVIAEQREYTQEVKANREELDIRAEAMVRQAKVESEAGEISKQTRDTLQDLLDKYEKIGGENGVLAEYAAGVGILSSAQEKANAAAEREAEKLAKSTKATKDKTAAQKDLAAVTDEVSEALRSEIDALEDEADAASEGAKDAAKALADAEARIKELVGKGGLSAEESEELFQLESKLLDLRKAATKAAEEDRFAKAQLQGATEELSEAEDEAGDFVSDLTDTLGEQARQLGLTREEFERLVETGHDAGGAYREAAAEFEVFSTEQGEGIEVAERFGEVFVRTMEDGSTRVTNFTEEIGILDDELSDVADTTEKVDAAVSSITEPDRLTTAAELNERIADAMERQATAAERIAAAFERTDSAAKAVDETFGEPAGEAPSGDDLGITGVQ